MILFEDTLTEFANNLIADIKYEMQNQGLGGSNLKKSLDYEVKGDRVTVTAAPYLKYAQKGRGPGGVPRNFTEILETWITSRGLKPEKGTITDFANAIKWSTIKRGSYLYNHPSEQRDVITQPLEENLDWLEQEAFITVMKEFKSGI